MTAANEFLSIIAPLCFVREGDFQMRNYFLSYAIFLLMRQSDSLKIMA